MLLLPRKPAWQGLEKRDLERQSSASHREGAVVDDFLAEATRQNTMNTRAETEEGREGRGPMRRPISGRDSAAGLPRVLGQGPFGPSTDRSEHAEHAKGALGRQYPEQLQQRLCGSHFLVSGYLQSAPPFMTRAFMRHAGSF